MKIEFSHHAAKRLGERNISRRIIKEILTNADNIKHIEDNKFICDKKVGRKNLVVVFIKRREYVKIITVYYENNV